MNMVIAGKQIEIGSALPEHVRGRLVQLGDKYGCDPDGHTVTFSREGAGFKAEIRLRANDLDAVATAQDADIYRAFDAAFDRVAKQLRRHKRRRTEHRTHVATLAAMVTIH